MSFVKKLRSSRSLRSTSKEVENTNNRDGRPSGPAGKKRKVDDNLYDIIYFSDEDDAIGSRIPSGSKNKKTTNEGLKEKLGDYFEEDNDDIESTNVLEADNKEDEDHSDSDETTTRHTGQVFKCRNCDFSAYRKIDLKIHWETIHVGHDSRRDDVETVTGKSKGLSTRQYFKCTLCGKSYQSLPSLNRHITVCKQTSVIELFVPHLEHDMKDKDKEGVLEFVDASAPDIEVVVGVGEGEGEVVVGVGEEEVGGLGEDLQKIDCGKRFECSTCQKKFKLRVQLVKHERSCHRKEDAIEGREKRQTAGQDELTLIAKHIEFVKINSHCCRHCNYRSSKREDVIQHNMTSDCKKMAPAIEGVYACRKCDFISRSREDLEEHLLVNSCKRFACVVCGTRFRKRVKLIHHYGYHTGVEYKCPVCDKGFYKLDSMKVHQKLHTGVKPHECEVCQKRFSTSSLLRVHERIHTGYKPYECAYCDRSFTGKTSRDRHQRVHTGEKPFPCKYCGKRYSENSNCVKHERKCDGTNPDEKKQGGRVSNQLNVPVRKEVNKQGGRVMNPLDVPVRKEVVSNVGDVRKEKGGDTAESTSNELKLQHSDNVKLVPEHEELFKCISCFEDFNTLAQLVDHERDEHYKCKTCGKSYSDMEFLLLHEKLHPVVTHDDKFETSFVPDEPFPSEEELETSFVPDKPSPNEEEFETSFVPDKPSPNGESLSESIHSNVERKNCKDSSQNRIKCNTCKRVFCDLSNLARHQLSHFRVLVEMYGKDLEKEEHVLPGDGEDSVQVKEETISNPDIELDEIDIDINLNDVDIDVSSSPIKEFASTTKCDQLKSHEKPRLKQAGSNENSGKEKLTKVNERTDQDGEEYVDSEEEFDDEDHDVDYVFDSAEDSEGDEDCMKDESTSFTRKKQKSEKSEPTFKCQLCNKNLTRLQIIEGHECSKFLCKTCGKQFAHKSHLRRHEISHSREKPYKCDLCDKAYFRADMLVDHRRTHPGYKPHQCAICKTCFTIKKLLHEHLKVVHSKDRNLGEYCVYTNSMSPGDTGNSNCSNPRKNVENEEEERIEEGEQVEGKEKIEKECEIIGDGEHKELERIEEDEEKEDEIIEKECEIIGEGEHKELERIEEEEKVEQGEEEIIGKEAAIIIGVGEQKGQDEGEENREVNDDGDIDFNVEDNTNNDEDYGCYDEEGNDEVDKFMKQLFDKGFGKKKNNDDVDKGSGKQENDDDKISDKLEGNDSVKHEAEQLTDEEIEIDGLIESLSKNVKVEIYVDNYKGQRKRKKLHKCTACSYITDSRQSLLIHERKHTGERPYQCKICLKSYVTASILAQHERKHTGEKPFVCEICGRAFAEKGAMKRHIKSLHNMERPFRCDFNCGKVFSSKRSMERHVRGNHTGERPFACPLCPKRFFDRSNYRRHIKRHEPKPVVEDSDEGEAVVDSVVVKNVLTRREAREVKPEKAIVISNNETVAVEQHTTQEYLCRVCTFSDASMAVVEEHQKTHRVFKCRSCALRFTDKEHLLEHKRREHVEEKPYMCGVCGKAFKRRDVMQRHEKLHSSTDRFECSYCGKQFATRPSLITHEKKHSGVRPYLCSQCSCMFTEKGCLLRHERAVHSSERPFMCSQCPKTFALKNNLVRHERSHLPVRMVKCEECDAHFKEQTNLLRHRKRVHGYVTPKSVFEYVNTS